MAVYDDSFEFNGETFDGRRLNGVVFGDAVERDRKGGSASETYLIRKSASSAFATAAIGAITKVGGTDFVRTPAVRHSEFRDLVARRVRFTDYLPPQEGDSESENWRTAIVTYEHPDKGDDGELASAGSDVPEERLRWSEKWTPQIDLVPYDHKIDSAIPRTETRTLYLVSSRIELTQQRVPEFDAAGAAAMGGKISSDAIELPSGISLSAEFVLYLGSPAELSVYETGGRRRQEWTVTHVFLFRPYSWNKEYGRDGVLADRKWPDGGAAAYRTVDLQPLIDAPGDLGTPTF